MTVTTTRDHISPVFASLNWLLIKLGIEFKILRITSPNWPLSISLTYKDLIVPYIPTRGLCTGSIASPMVPRSGNQRFQPSGSFPVEPAPGLGTKCWNPIGFKKQTWNPSCLYMLIFNPLTILCLHVFLKSLYVYIFNNFIHFLAFIFYSINTLLVPADCTLELLFFIF